MAMELLAERWSVHDVARHVGVAPRTIRSWRASPEGHKLLEAARDARREAFKDALVKARRTLIESLPEAADALCELLQHSKAEARLRAVFGIMDRTGLHPRSEFDPPPDTDFSNLTDEELKTYLELSRKLSPGV
jgi:transposase-like protein